MIQITGQSLQGFYKLTACDSAAITAAIEYFYTSNHNDVQKMVMFTSGGVSVIPRKNNGVATLLCRDIP